MQREEIEEIKERLLHRLAAMPSYGEVIVNAHPYRRADIIQRVEKEDSVGQKMIEREVRISKALQTNNVWL